MFDLATLQGKLIIFGIIAILFVGLAGWWYIRGQEIDNLNLQISQLTQQLEVADKRIAQAEHANAITAQTIEAQRRTANAINDIVRNLRTREGNNDQVSPIIRDAFDSIERMRASPQRGSGTTNSPRQP